MLTTPRIIEEGFPQVVGAHAVRHAANDGHGLVEAGHAVEVDTVGQVGDLLVLEPI
jgi:hypothetical protein